MAVLAAPVAVLVGLGSYGTAVPAFADAGYEVVVGPSGVNVRSTADISSDSNIVGGVFNHERVSIVCTTQGPTVKGPLGTTSLWNRIGPTKSAASGGLVNDSFVRTNTNGPVAKPCQGQSATKSPGTYSSTSGSGSARVNTNGSLAMVRSEPSTAPGTLRHKYKDGTPVKLKCEIYGGGRVWVKLTSGEGFIAKDLVSGGGGLPDCPPSPQNDSIDRAAQSSDAQSPPVDLPPSGAPLNWRNGQLLWPWEVEEEKERRETNNMCIENGRQDQPDRDVTDFCTYYLAAAYQLEWNKLVKQSEAANAAARWCDRTENGRYAADAAAMAVAKRFPRLSSATFTLSGWCLWQKKVSKELRTYMVENPNRSGPYRRKPLR